MLVKKFKQVTYEQDTEFNLEKYDIDESNILSVSAALSLELIEDTGREHFVVIYLSSDGSILGYEVMSVGNSRSVPFDINTVIRNCLELNCREVVFVHNHPNVLKLMPSSADKDAFFKFCESGKLFGIDGIDSLIVSNRSESYYSIRKNSINFFKEKINPISNKTYFLERESVKKSKVLIELLKTLFLLFLIIIGIGVTFDISAIQSGIFFTIISIAIFIFNKQLDNFNKLLDKDWK